MRKIITNNINRRKFVKIVGLSLTGSVSYGLYHFYKEKIIKTKWTGYVLNNKVSLEIHSQNKKNNYKIIKEVERFIYKADSIFNLQNNKSEIVRLNSEKYIYDPSESLIDVIQKSQAISRKTEGIFDITVQPLWNFYYKHFIIENKNSPPANEDIKKITKMVNWKNVIIKDNKISLLSNASITLNGIAQGWITDEIKKILQKNGISDTLIDFGETFALGNFEKKRPWNILLQGPDGVEEVISLSNKAVATSSGYGTMFEPTAEYNHIFNPKTGISENKYKAVSIVSDNAWLSDAISTSALLLNRNKIKEVCNYFSVEAYLVEDKKFKKFI